MINSQYKLQCRHQFWNGNAASLYAAACQPDHNTS